MPNRLSHFSIPCADVDRAKRFYEAVFQWRIEPWGPPGYYLILPDDPERAVTGDLHERAGARAETGAAGSNARLASRTSGRSPMPSRERRPDRRAGVSDRRRRQRAIYFIDTEGNRVGAMRYDAACG